MRTRKVATLMFALQGKNFSEASGFQTSQQLRYCKMSGYIT